MMIVGEEKPSLDDLQHYGVLGMKWGKRKKYSSDDIKDARIRLAGKNQQFDKLIIKRAGTKKGTAARAKADKEVDAFERKWNKDPDRVAATRYTTGEKAITALFAVPTFGATVVGAGISTLVNRRIEYKQDNNKYDKK